MKLLLEVVVTVYIFFLFVAIVDSGNEGMNEENIFIVPANIFLGKTIPFLLTSGYTQNFFRNGNEWVVLYEKSIWHCAYIVSYRKSSVTFYPFSTPLWSQTYQVCMVYQDMFVKVCNGNMTTNNSLFVFLEAGSCVIIWATTKKHTWNSFRCLWRRSEHVASNSALFFLSAQSEKSNELNHWICNAVTENGIMVIWLWVCESEYSAALLNGVWIKRSRGLLRFHLNVMEHEPRTWWSWRPPAVHPKSLF